MILEFDWIPRRIFRQHHLSGGPLRFLAAAGLTRSGGWSSRPLRHVQTALCIIRPMALLHGAPVSTFAACLREQYLYLLHDFLSPPLSLAPNASSSTISRSDTEGNSSEQRCRYHSVCKIRPSRGTTCIKVCRGSIVYLLTLARQND